MNKKNTLSIVALALLTAGAWMLSTLNSDNPYQPRVKDALSPEGQKDIIAKMRNNQITGDVPAEAFNQVRTEVINFSDLKDKAEWPVNWEFAGPDNMGGCTRAILVDQQDNNVLYAAASGGAIFRSDNKGGTWYPLESENNGFGMVSMAQTKNNTIFAGTGDDFVPTAHLGEKGTIFLGSGIYRSTDGETFEHLSNTSSFGYVPAMAAHPTQDWIFAGTRTGLRYSDDNGDTWKLIRPGACKDIKINENGVALVYLGATLYRSTDPTNSSSYQLVSGINAGGTFGRMVIGWSESDADYGYVATAGQVTSGTFNSNSGLTGLWKTTDGGLNWTEIVNQGSSFFNPFTSGSRGQAWHDMTIAVHPRNKDRVFIGGIGFAEWTLEEGPKMVGNNSNHPSNPFGIHADKHVIVFDNTGEDPIMYIGSDGGVSATTNDELNRYTDRTTNYVSTQFYAMDANPRGQIIGSAQDQGNILVGTESFPRKPGEDIFSNVEGIGSADGFGTEMSHYNSDVMFIMAQQAALARSVDGGQNAFAIWDNRIRAVFPTGATIMVKQSEFATGLHLWEDNDLIDETQLEGRTATTDSNFRSRIFLHIDNGVWMCNNAHGSLFNPESSTDESVRWFKIARSNIGSIYNFGTTRDGNSVFATNGGGQVYRIDGLNKANWDTTELVQYDAISDSLTLTNITNNLGIGGRHITDISVDPSDDNRVLITVGNYGNQSFVFITENALDPSPTWTNLQNNLPRFPVYAGMISADDPSVIIIGTEYGIYATNNGFSSSPQWVEAGNGVDPSSPFPAVPVFDLVQVASKPWSGHSIYAATHGMGMYKTGSLLTSVKPESDNSISSELKIYPNPANNSCFVKTSIKGSFKVNVYSITGELMSTSNGQSNGTIELSTADLANGNYFVEVLGDHDRSVAKMIVQH